MPKTHQLHVHITAYIPPSTHIKQDICAEHAKMPPMRRVLDIEVAAKEFVRGSRRAELAVTRCARVLKVATGHGDVVLHVAAAGCTAGRA